jgi:hypothetical protein
VLHWSIAVYGAKTWTLQKVNQKYLESFDMSCWRSIEKIIWTDHVRNEEMLHRVKEERNILHRVKRRKASWIGHIMHRIFLLKHVIEGKIWPRIEVMGRQGRNHKQLLGDLKEKRGNWKLNEQAPNHPHFGRGYGPLIKQTIEWMMNIVLFVVEVRVVIYLSNLHLSSCL